MPTITITNKIPSQALRGQNVKVTVDLSTESSQFSQLKIGQLCENTTNNFQGLVYSIDSFGNTFEICPLQPNFNMATGSTEKGAFYGCLVDIPITVTI